MDQTVGVRIDVLQESLAGTPTKTAIYSNTGHTRVYAYARYVDWVPLQR